MERIEMQVLCVGVGGTGGYFIKEFARYAASMNRDDKVRIKFAFCDGDVVERKNLDRQCFQEEDIGENKAVVLAGAIRDCLGLTAISFPQYIDDSIDLKIMFEALDGDYYYGRKKYRVLVGCVDNHPARRAMEKYYKSVTDIAYIDSANEFMTGEVVSSYRIGTKSHGKPRSFYFPDVLKDRERKASERSCAETNESSPQHIITNMLAGQITLAKVIQFVSRGIIAPGIHHFDAFNAISSFTPFAEKDTENEKEECGDGIF